MCIFFFPHRSLQKIAPTISGSQVQCHAPADPSSSPTGYELSVAELEKVLDYQCGEYRNRVPFGTTSPSATGAK